MSRAARSHTIRRAFGRRAWWARSARCRARGRRAGRGRVGSAPVDRGGVPVEAGRGVGGVLHVEQRRRRRVGVPLVAAAGQVDRVAVGQQVGEFTPGAADVGSGVGGGGEGCGGGLDGGLVAGQGGELVGCGGGEHLAFVVGDRVGEGVAGLVQVSDGEAEAFLFDEGVPFGVRVVGGAGVGLALAECLAEGGEVAVVGAGDRLVGGLAVGVGLGPRLVGGLVGGGCVEDGRRHVGDVGERVGCDGDAAVRPALASRAHRPAAPRSTRLIRQPTLTGRPTRYRAPRLSHPRPLVSVAHTRSRCPSGSWATKV